MDLALRQPLPLKDKEILARFISRLRAKIKINQGN